MRLSRLVLVGFVAALSPFGCTPPAPKPSGPLTAVSPLPKAPLPSWITEISPTGVAKEGAQIRVRFQNDVIPLDALESPERQTALSHFSLTPALPGRFIFLTPRMVGFEADASIPKAARLRAAIGAGLVDLKGNKLDVDYAWTFSTEKIALSDLPGTTYENEGPVGLNPTFTVSSNVELDENSLAAHTTLRERNNAQAKPIDVRIVHEPSPSATASEEPTGANPAEQSFTYRLRPNAQLAGNRGYEVAFAAGILPAKGNLPSAIAYRGSLQTYGPLAFTGVTLEGRRRGSPFSEGSPALRFSNGLDAASARTALTISPAPNRGVPLLHAEDGGLRIDINPYALKPRTHYAFTIAPSLKDQFGQRLGQETKGRFETSDYVAEVWAPSGLSIFPSDANLQLNVQATNLPEGSYQSAFRVVEPGDLLTNDPENYGAALGMLPPKASWSRWTIAQQPNRQAIAPVPLRRQIGGTTGMLAYGVTASIPSAYSGEPQVFDGFVQLTNIGIFAQWFPSGGIIRTARLSDGSPLPNAKIDVYQSLLDAQSRRTGSRRPCAGGTTDKTGTWNLDSAAFAACASTAKDGETAPELLVIARNGQDWTFVRTFEYSGEYGAGIFAGWSAGLPDAHGTIVSDRSLYQPGETAQFVALGYFDENGKLVRGRASSYAVRLESPSGRKIGLGNRSLDEFGSFTVAWPIDKRAEVGFYTISASASNGEAISGTFRVAQFKPPNFRVDLSLDQQHVTGGATVNATTKSTYLFGAPVEGGKSHYYVTRQQSTYVPKGWEDFDFGRSWYYPEEPPSVDSDVLQKDVTTGADGNSALTVAVASDLPFAMDYRVDSETTDVSNLTVADSKTFTAFPGDATIGLRGGFVATAGTPFEVEVIVLDLQGKPVSGRGVKLVLQQRTFSNVTQLVEGSESARPSVHYSDVQTIEVSSGAAPVKATLSAPKPGSYRVRANFSGAKNEATASDHDLWISGPGEFDWGGDQDVLKVKLDKKVYKPGDTATALIQSPYPDAELFFAVIRHGFLYRTTQTVHGPAPRVHFAVSSEMLPNAAVEAVVVRRGKPLSQGVPPGLGKLARTGFAPFNVTLDEKYLKVAVTPTSAQVSPGSRQHLAIRLTGKDGKPAAGELAIAVVNDAVLQLTGYRFPDLVKIVYADQPISTRFADNRALVKLVTEHKYVNKGFGYGGGAMAGAAGTRVRTHFKPIAYWNGALRTDANGSASAGFTLPDDLTTWRVLAIALTKDARFGHGETSFVATKPLVTNPVLPQFARPGDRFQAGVSVTNVAKTKGQLSIDATLTNDLIFTSGPAHQKHLDASIEGLTQAYRFEVTSQGGRNASFQVATKLGNESDAFAFPVEMRTNDVLETVATSGATATTATVPLDVPQSRLGGLDFTLASTLLGELSEPQQILKEDRPVFTTGIASRIAVAADTMMLARQAGIATVASDLQKKLNADLDALEAQALPDGGYAPWPGAQRGDIWSTAFIVTQLQQAKLAGFNPGGIAHAQRFLEAILATPTLGYPVCDVVCRAENRLEALETFGTLGQPRSDYLSDIWALHEKFTYVEQVELARHLLKVPGWHDQAIALRDKLLQQSYETTRRASVNVPTSFETNVAMQSQMLGLMLDSGMPVERIDKMVSALLGQRGKDGRWLCFCDDGEAMNALVSYAQGAGKPRNFDADAVVGLLNHHSSFTDTLRVDAFSFGFGSNGVPAGKSTVTLTKKGDGTLHYTLALRYQAPEVSAGVYSGIRIDRRLHPANDPKIIAGFGLPSVPADATHVAANRVFEIEDRITTDHPLDHVVVVDPLPAGLEAVDTSFRTTTQFFQAHADDWQIDYQAIYKDRVLAFAHYLPAGVYAVRYLVRSVTPGSFDWPGAQVSLQYAPEEFGRTAGTRLTIDQPK